MGKEQKIIICLGGEGECIEAINVNHKCITSKGWRVSRDGRLTLDDVKKVGPVVIADSDYLPFATECADEVQLNGVPVGDHTTYLGKAYSPSEIKRIAKFGLKSVTGSSAVYLIQVNSQISPKL